MEGHPGWCVRGYCTANRTNSGAHRSAPIIVSDAPLPITANLYADAALPGDVLVEVRGLPVLLPARMAYGLGRVLVSLGKAGDPP
jgi:hypothetical protein